LDVTPCPGLVAVGPFRDDDPSSIRETDVLIVGAGPTGLVLALWLTRLGVRVRIIDKTTEPGTTSRAVAVQARTLELYSQIGLADEVVARDGRPRRESLGGWHEVARAVFATWVRASARSLRASFRKTNTSRL